MLAKLSLMALAVPQVQEPPTTSALMDMPVCVIGDQAGAELTYSESGEPPVALWTYDSRFRLSNMFNLPSGLTINSFSRGTGALYSARENATDQVWPDVGELAWSFKIFAIGTIPGMSTSWAGTPYAAEGNVAGDVFAIIDQLDGGAFPDEQVGVVHKVRDGLDVGVAPLRGLDSYLPGVTGIDEYVTEMEAEIGAGEPEFYFTVKATGQYELLIPSEWVANDSQKRPSTVFRVVYKSGKWGRPSVAWTASDLGIDQWTEITALSVMDPEFEGASQAKGIELLYCTNSTAWSEKIMVRGYWWNGTGESLTVGPLYDGAGGYYVQTKLGFNGPHQIVVGSCDEDPGDDGQPWIPHLEYRRETTALVSGTVGADRDLIWSAHRLRYAQNLPYVSYRFSLQGHATGQDSVAVLTDNYPNGTPYAIVPRDSSRGVYPQSNVVDIPLSGSFDDLRLRWYVLDRNGNLLAKSYEFTIKTR